MNVSSFRSTGASITLAVIFFAAVIASDAQAGGVALRRERLTIWASIAGSEAVGPPVHTTTSILLPVAGVQTRDLSDSFDHARSHGRRHRAIDIAAASHTPVLAAVDGTIRKLVTSTAGGVTIYQFDEMETRVFYYAHLQRYRQGLREGTLVRRGDVIGYVGMSGNAEGPHLHFAIGELPPSKEWWKGVPIDPYPLLVGGMDTTTDSTALRER